MSETNKKIRPQDKWDAKTGVISKTYKVNKEVAEQFQTAGKKADVAIGTQITKMKSINWHPLQQFWTDSMSPDTIPKKITCYF